MENKKVSDGLTLLWIMFHFHNDLIAIPILHRHNLD